MVSSWLSRKIKRVHILLSNHSTRIVETENDRFIEKGEVSGNEEPLKVEIKEVRVRVFLSFTCFKDVVPKVVLQPNNQQEQ